MNIVNAIAQRPNIAGVNCPYLDELNDHNNMSVSPSAFEKRFQEAGHFFKQPANTTTN